MSERKVLQKYYPPDFDPSSIARTKKPKDATSKLQQVRLMAPFSMKCTACGEYIYKGRKFNARKETTDETYYAIKIIRFYIKCTRCSAEITFKTDPKHNDYEAEKGAMRNFEMWRASKLAEETEEEVLDRLAREEADKDAMQELESKTLDAKTEMAIADKLDEIRTRNARMERTDKSGVDVAAMRKAEERDEERERQEREDEEAARQAFLSSTGEKVRRLQPEEEGGDGQQSMAGGDAAAKDADAMPPPSFQRVVKKRKADLGVALGIKKKAPKLSA